jgi:hypothetical protein
MASKPDDINRSIERTGHTLRTALECWRQSRGCLTTEELSWYLNYSDCFSSLRKTVDHHLKSCSLCRSEAELLINLCLALERAGNAVVVPPGHSYEVSTKAIQDDTNSADDDDLMVG